MAFETAPEALKEHVPLAQSIVERPLDMPAQIGVQITKAEQLNALSFVILEKQREQKLTVTKEVKDAIRSRLEQLNAATVEKNLDALRSRLTFVQQILSQPDTAAAQPAPAPQTGNFLTNMMKNFQSTVSGGIGSLVGNLALPDFVKRGFFQVMTVPQFLPGGQFLAKSFIETGERNLALMDMKDFLAQSPDFTLPTTFSNNEWAEFKRSGKSIEELVAAYVSAIRANERLATTADKNITLTKLLNVKSRETQFESQATQTLVASIKANDSWKTPEQADITDVKFSDTETSVDVGGALTASRADFDVATGAPREGTKAFKLAEMKRALPHATRLVLGTEPTKGSIEWIGSSKVATIPAGFGIALPVVDELLAMSKPESVSKVEIGDTDSLKSDTVELSFQGERGVIRMRKNTDVLTALIGTIKTLTTEENERRKWKYADGKLTPIDPVKLS